MIDSLEMMRGRIEREDAAVRYGMKLGGFGLVTLHRPSNVDDSPTLAKLCGVLTRISQRLPLIFPVHPRTRKNLESFGLLAELQSAAGVRLEEPLSYIPFMSLLFGCRLAITDSGGIQEETTYLGIPCLTLRPNTERPVTVSQGTNRLCTIDNVEAHVTQVLDHPPRIRQVPELWDGRTANRVVESIRRFLSI